MCINQCYSGGDIVNNSIFLDNNKYLINCVNGDRMVLEFIYDSAPMCTMCNTITNKKILKKDINNVLGNTIQYKKIKSNSILNSSCLICLDHYIDNDKIRVLSKCKHIYHKICIDKWVQKNNTCPICRTSY
jgi:hypothetical protein